jgi:hypothetical protein
VHPSFLPALIFACICLILTPCVLFFFLFRWCGVRRPLSYHNCRCRVCPVDLICSDSPRVYLSTNPWKVTSTIQTVSSTRDEYVALIDKLKASASKKPKLKTEIAHQNLISVLEGRIEVIDKELAVRFFEKQQRFSATGLGALLPYSPLYFSCPFVLPRL